MKEILNRRFFRRQIWVRKLVQAFFFILVALISVNHTLAELGKGFTLLSSASLHALCPFGGVVTIYQYLAVGTFVQKIHEFLVHPNDHRLADGAAVRAGLLRVGVSVRHGARVVRSHRAQTL